MDGTRSGRRRGREPHVIAVTLCSVLCGSIMLVLGVALLAVPSVMIRVLFGCLIDDESETNNKSYSTLLELTMTLSRVTGGVFVALSVSTLSLLLPTALLDACCDGRQQPTATTSTSSSIHMDKCRSSLASQAITGLVLVLVGLVDNRMMDHQNQGNDDGACSSEVKTAWLLGGGALLLVLACTGMMLSFWPSTTTAVVESVEGASTTSIGMPSRLLEPQSERRLCCFKRHTAVAPVDITDANENTVPLLSEEDRDEEALRYYENDENVPEDAQETEQIRPGSDSNEEDGTITSRITGTRRLLKLAAPQVFYLYAGCAVLLVRLPFSLSIPHFVSTTLGALGRGDFEGARMEILLLFILGTIDAALDFWCVFLFGYAKERIVRGVRIDTFASILKQEISFFDNHTSGNLSSRLTSDCGEMAGDLTWFFRFSIESVVRISGITMYMLIRSPMLGGCALCIVPVVGVVNKKYGDWLSKNAIAVQNALAKANSVAQEAFSCVRTVVAFASEDFEHGKYREAIDVQYELNIRQLYMTGVYYMVISTFLINTCVQAALLLLGTALIQHGKLTPEILLAFMLYQGQLQNETLNLFQSYSSLIKSSGAGDKVFGLLDRTPPPPGTGSPDVVVGEEPEDDESTEDKHGQSSVQLRDVLFFYPSRPSHTVLQSFNINIPAGSTLALCGPSGCGKSTVIGLLQRFYDPTHGEVFIDGTDLRSMNIKVHRRNIGTVTQDPVLFSGTILSNINYGHPAATREEAIEAAKLANAHEFVSSFPNGYDTEVGERGIQLSGGQKQRIAIARAINSSPALLLLDEATSALDAESEHVVQEALDRLLNTNKDMTTVVVAHRLRTVRNADCIAFIEQGRVVEKGTHEELMELPDGHYRKMVERAGSSGQLPEK